MARALSYSEISTALTCEARHAFAYTGHLTGGDALRRRAVEAQLSNGRAWGAAVASWHAFSRHPGLESTFDPALARIAAIGALNASYARDADEQADAGVWIDPAVLTTREAWLSTVLEHYMDTAQPMDNLTRLEDELDAPIPSRTGRRSSNLYRFTGFIDGFTTDDLESEWLAEYKLRRSLVSAEIIQLSRQIRWYAWLRQRETGRPVVGVIVDERLAAAPKPARVVQGPRKGTLTASHAIDQLTTPESYVECCERFGVEPHPDTVMALKNRQWQKRTPIQFGPGELDEAGRELVSAAKLIRDLDLGKRYPIRNAQPHICSGCRFREACPAPDNRAYLETIFEFKPPKRDRELAEAA